MNPLRESTFKFWIEQLFDIKWFKTSGKWTHKTNRSRESKFEFSIEQFYIKPWLSFNKFQITGHPFYHKTLKKL